MQVTVLHVIPDLSSRRVAPLLARMVSADRGPHAARHIVVSFAEGAPSRDALQESGVKVHCVGRATLLHTPAVLVRLMLLMRRTQPDVVMTWLYRAHVLGMLAAITSGRGASRVVWNVSGSSTNSPTLTLKSRLKLVPLAVLSPLPWGIAAGSRSEWQAHKSLGLRPRRWCRLHNSARESATEKVLNSYRQLWRFASGIEALPARRGIFRRRIRPRLRYWSGQLRRRLLVRTTFVGVTGSCGKTTTVSLAADLLATDGSCYCREYQNTPGISATTVLSAPAWSKYCIQEISGDFPGAITAHVGVLKPHIGIVTTVGTDHYTTFRSLEAIAEEKGQLVEALPKRGTAILNADDPNVRAMAARTRARVLLFGLSPDADIRATEVSSVWPDRLSLTVIRGQERVHIQTKLVGEYWTTSILAAMACAIACGIDLETCARIIETFEPTTGRNSIHGEPGGPVFILDNAKAPFWTIPASLAFLAQANAPRKTAVFGTISDMPGRGHKKYRQVARKALEVADRVIFVGPQADAVDKMLRQKGLQERLSSFQTSYQASAFLSENPLADELIYIKASLTDHLERIMLSQLDRVVCWRERCRIGVACPRCSDYGKPHPPPFGLVVGDSIRPIGG